MKIDTSIIEEAFAEAERFNEDLGADKDGLTASQLRILADDIAGRIHAKHPRFRPSLFLARCFPRAEERKKQAILRTLGVNR